MTDDPERKLASVTRLPGSELVLAPRQLHAQAAQARWSGYRRDVVAVTTVTRKAVTHPRTVTASRTLARNALYVPIGAWLILNRGRHRRGLPNRMLRAAEAAGNTEQIQYWEERDELRKERSHRRVMNWLKAPLEWLRAIAVTGVAGIVCLFGVGILVALYTKDISWVFAPLITAGAVIAFTVTIVTAFYGVLMVTIPIVGVTICWHLGRKANVTPTWLAAERDKRDDSITPLGVTAALAHLNIPAINKAIKDGWRPEFHTVPTLVNNRGYHTVVSLPMGVTPGMVADRRDVLARNLVRAPLETWPTDSDHRGYLDLWVAHPGATSKAGSPYPLLHEGTVDVFKSVPFGESQRGDIIGPPLVEANMVVGGLPGQGKSNACRVIMAGAALDPLAVLRAYVFAGNGDFDAYEPRLDRYRRGVDDAVVRDAVQELREQYAEVERREQRLAELGAKKLSRSIASKYPDMRPIVTVFSECHEMFSHPDFGKEAADLAVAMLKRSRKTGLVTLFDTQSSRADAIPLKIVELMKYNACFAVKTWRNNDGFLGDGSYASGVRATELRAGKDRGTSLITGVTEERFEILNWFYLEADDDTGYDSASVVIERAMKKVKKDVVGRPGLDEIVVRDLLSDVMDELAGRDRERASHMAVLLDTLDPDYYRGLDGVKLAAMLAEEKVEVTVNKGNPMIYAERVRQAMNWRGE